VRENYTLHLSSGLTVQLDIFVPKEKLAFEYQGQQHFSEIWALGSQWEYIQRDKDKRLACKENEIALIEVPYWWDFEKNSLLATIHQLRPDLVPAVSSGKPILPQQPKLLQIGIILSNLHLF
jgi:hypothetical protein